MKGSHLVLGAAVALAPSVAHADVAFGAHDVPTVFFISKSDDHNRVDYGVRLDSRCARASDDPVFPYWREFERSPPVRTHGLNAFEHVPYGIADQRVTARGPAGGTIVIRLKQLNRPITIVTKVEPDGKCSAIARTVVARQDAVLLSVYAKLAGAMSVDYIDVHGKSPDSGAIVDERIKR